MKKIYNLLLIVLCLNFNPIFSKSIVDQKLKKSLESLYNYSPKLKYERELLKSKDEMMPQAYSEFRPEISGYYEKGKSDTNSSGFNITSDGIRTETNKGIIISQNLFDGGSSISKVGVAKNEIIAQRFLLKNIEQEVFLDAIKLYADLATETSNLELNKKNVEFLKEQLSLTKQQFEIGEVTLTDVSIAEARFSLSESELLKTANDINSLSAKFLALFGINPEEPELNNELFQEKFDIIEAKELSKKKNPKIQNIFFQIKSSEKQIESLKRKRLPSVKLEAEAKINKGYFRSDSEREVLSAITRVDIPLYQSGSASSKIREERKKLFALKELLNQQIKEVEYNLVSAISSYDYSFSRIGAYKKQIKSNKIFLEGLKQELLLGERTMLDLLDGEQELLKSQLDLVRAKRDLFISFYEILFYIGNLNANYLSLEVDYFNDLENFNKVKYKWLDIIE